MIKQESARAPIKASKRSGTIHYAIRDIVASAQKLGREVIYLNIGDPVKFGFKTPDHIKQALYQAVKENFNEYTESEGLPELREAIAKRESKTKDIAIDPKDVVVTSGVSEGIQMVMGSLIEEGDEVLMAGPSYQPYISYLRFFGGVPVEYKTDEEKGWAPDVEDLKSKMTKKTKAIVVVNPNNPTGSIYDENALEQISSIAVENNLLIITDEIYDELTFEGRFKSITSFHKEVPVIGLNGFSKSSLMTGWRLGYVFFRGYNGSLDELREAVVKQARIRLCANTPVQHAALAAISGPRDHVASMVSELKRRRDYSLKRISEIKGLSSAKPHAAFYLFPKIDSAFGGWKNDTEFVLDLLSETSILLAPGSGFGETYGKSHFRMVFLPEMEILETAFNRIGDFMSKRSGKT